MRLLKTLAASAVAIALSVCVAEAYPHNPPGPRGGPGTDWHNPPGPRGGPGASRFRHPYARPFYYGWHYTYWRGRPVYWWRARHCWYAPQYDNPPGPAGGPGTNWRNPPGPVGGPGASPSFCR